MKDESYAASGVFPLHPGDNAGKVQTDKWLTECLNSLQRRGKAIYMTAADPDSHGSMAIKPVLTVPVGQIANVKLVDMVALRNVEIEHSNLNNTTEWLRYLRDIRNQEAAHLAQAMRQGAPIELLALELKHKCAAPHDAMIDGRAIWLELFALKGNKGDREAVRTAYKQMSWLREHKLPSNSTKADFLHRVKDFTVEVNPHLDQPYLLADLSRLYVEWIPEDLAIDQRILEREFDKAGSWVTPASVQTELCELFIRCHKPNVHAPEYLSCMDAVAAALCPRPVAPVTQAKTDAPGTAAGTADMLRARALGGDAEALRLLALMMDKKKDKKRGDKKGNKDVAGVTRIASGKLCTSGTCHFDHDVKFPGQKCYRDPRWNGPLPADYADRPATVARINDDRAANAKKMGVGHTPLQIPAKGAGKPVHPLLAHATPVFGMFGMPETETDFLGQGCELEPSEPPEFSGQGCEDEDVEEPQIDEDDNFPMAPLLPGAAPIPPSTTKGGQGDKNKHWYVVFGGPNEGIHYGEYDFDVRHLVEGFPGCTAYGPRHGLHSQATAEAALQAHKERRARESMDPMYQVRQPAVQAPALPPAAAPAPLVTAEADAPTLPPVAPPVALPVAAPLVVTAPPAQPKTQPHVHIPELPEHARDPDWEPRVNLRKQLLEAYRLGAYRHIHAPPPIDAQTRPHLSLPNMSPGSQRGQHYRVDIQDGDKDPVQVNLAGGYVAKVASFVRIQICETEPYLSDREMHPPKAGEELQLAIRGSLIEAYESISAQIGMYAPNETVSESPVKEEIIILVLARQLEDDFRWAFNYALEHPYYKLPVVNVSLTARGVCALSLALFAMFCLALAVGGSAAPMAFAMATASGSSSMQGIRGGAIGPYQLARIAAVAASSMPTLCLILCLLMTVWFATNPVVPRLRRLWRRLCDLDGQRLIAAAFAMMAVYFACYASTSLGADALGLRPAAAIQGLQSARAWNYLPTSRMRATYDAEVQHGFRTRCNVVSLCNHDRLDHATLSGLAMVCPELPVNFNLALRLGDTGAFCHAVPDLKFAIPGTVRPNTLAVDTANGPSVPKTQCDVAMEVLLDDGTIRVVTLRNALVLDGKLRHTLVSLGTLAREGVAGTYLGMGNEVSSLRFADGACAPLMNVGVLVVPDPRAQLGPTNMPSASVVSGKTGSSHFTLEDVHRTFNHRSARVLSRLPKCVADAPTSWSSIGNFPCDDCLEANSTRQPQKGHIPQPKEPGYFSIDIYQLGVSHVHGGQKYLFGAHDLYSKLNWVCLMDSKARTQSILQPLRCQNSSHPRR